MTLIRPLPRLERGAQSARWNSLPSAAMSRPAASIRKVGDVDAASKGAAKLLEASYELPFLSHSPLEPMNFTADVRKDSAVLIGPLQFGPDSRCRWHAAPAPCLGRGSGPEHDC